MTIDDFESRLNTILDGDCLLISARESPPSPSEVDALSASLGMQLPDKFVAFQARYGAMYLEIKEEIWPRPAAYGGGAYYTFQYACWAFGIGPNIPEWLDIRAAVKEIRATPIDGSTGQFVPVFRWVASADRVCFDHRGRLCEVSHDSASPRPIEASFLDFLLTQFQNLVHNKSTLHRDAPDLFLTDEDRFQQRRAAAMKDADLTARRCPKCDSPCPSYRSRCKVCGHAIGRADG